MGLRTMKEFGGISLEILDLGITVLPVRVMVVSLPIRKKYLAQLALKDSLDALDEGCCCRTRPYRYQGLCGTKAAVSS